MKRNKKKLFGFFGGCFASRTVGLFVEVQEEERDEEAVDDECDAVALRVRTVGEVVGKRVDHDEQKLEQLHLSEILFPPQILLHGWTHCAKAVV